LVITTFKRISR